MTMAMTVMMAPTAVVSAVWMTVAIVASLTVTAAFATLTTAQMKKVAVAIVLAVVIAAAFSTTTYAAGFNCDYAWWTLECWLT